MSTYIFIHGGESFVTHAEYLDWTRTTAVEWNLEPYIVAPEKKKWKIEPAKKLTQQGHLVYMPNFPNPQNAKYEEWKTFFDAWISRIQIRGELVLLGNSLGGCFLLKYFSEKHHLSCQIYQVHLVAACIEAGDFSSPESYEFLQKLKNQVHIWHAEDDIVVPFSVARQLQHIFPEAETHLFPGERGYGHLYGMEHFSELEAYVIQ